MNRTLDMTVSNKAVKRGRLIAISAILVVGCAIGYLGWFGIQDKSNHASDDFYWKFAKIDPNAVVPLDDGAGVGMSSNVPFSRQATVDEAMLSAAPVGEPCRSPREQILHSVRDPALQPCSGVLFVWAVEPGRGQQLKLINFLRVRMPKETGKMVSVRTVGESFCQHYPSHCLSWVDLNMQFDDLPN